MFCLSGNEFTVLLLLTHLFEGAYVRFDSSTSGKLHNIGVQELFQIESSLSGCHYTCLLEDAKK